MVGSWNGYGREMTDNYRGAHVVSVGNALDFPGFPLSPAVVDGDRVFTAGLIPIDPASGDLVGSDIDSQAAQVIDNLEVVLAAAGSDLDHVLHVDIQLAELDRDFAAFNQVYAARFTEPYPARRTIGARLAMAGLLIEMQAIAVRR